MTLNVDLLLPVRKSPEGRLLMPATPSQPTPQTRSYYSPQFWSLARSIIMGPNSRVLVLFAEPQRVQSPFLSDDQDWVVTLWINPRPQPANEGRFYCFSKNTPLEELLLHPLLRHRLVLLPLAHLNQICRDTQQRRANLPTF